MFLGQAEHEATEWISLCLGLGSTMRQCVKDDFGALEKGNNVFVITICNIINTGNVIRF